MTVWRQSWTLFQLHCTRQWPLFADHLLRAFIFPVAGFYLGARLLSSPSDRVLVVAGFLTLGLSMGGTFLVGFSVLEDRFLGRLELLRSTPLRANSYHVSYVLLAVLQNMLFVLIALLTLHVLGLSKLGATMLFAGVLSAIAAGAAVGGLAILVGTWVPHLQEGNAILSLVALALPLSSPILYEESSLPRPLWYLIQLSPFTHIAEMFRSLISEGRVSPSSWLATGVVAMAYYVATARYAKWQGT